MKTLPIALLLLVSTQLSACSTSYWYNQIQGRQYDKCEKLANYEDRRRCKAETQPDQAKYDKQREASQAAAKE